MSSDLNIMEGSFNPATTSLDENEVRRYAGLRGSRFGERFIRKAIDETKIYAAPKGIWRMYDYDLASHTVKTEPPFPLSGSSIVRHLKGAEKVIFLAVTIGAPIEQLISDTFANGSYALALLIDASATAAVEKLADDLEQAIKQKISVHGYQMTWRFSPGYGDWDITSQKGVLPLTGGEKIGLKLTEGLMLLPRKSVTAVIGLLPSNATVCRKDDYHNCQGCGKLDCPARKTDFNCSVSQNFD